MNTSNFKKYIRIGIGCLFVFAGLAHFTNADFFNKLVPASMSENKEIFNIITAILQIGMGIVFWIPRFRLIARWSTIALLVGTLPAAINQVIHPETVESVGLGSSLAAIRVAIQICMIALIWWITITDKEKK